MDCANLAPTTTVSPALGAPAYSASQATIPTTRELVCSTADCPAVHAKTTNLLIALPASEGPLSPTGGAFLMTPAVSTCPAVIVESQTTTTSLPTVPASSAPPFPTVFNVRTVTHQPVTFAPMDTTWTQILPARSAPAVAQLAQAAQCVMCAVLATPFHCQSLRARASFALLRV